MPRSFASLLSVLAASVVLSVLLTVKILRLEPARPAAVPPDSLTARVESLARQVESLRGKASIPLDAIVDRLDSLEARLDALGAGDSGVTAERRPTPRPEEDLSAVSTEALALRARLSHGSADFGAAIRLWREVLSRELDEEKRIEGLRALGAAYRAVKDHANEEKVFREEMALHRAGSEEELTARFRVGYAVFKQGRHQEALPLMEPYAFDEEIPAESRSWARLWAAECMFLTGDRYRARRILEEIVDEYGDREDPGWRSLARRARDALARMDR